MKSKFHLILLALLVVNAAIAKPGYYRSPSIYEDTLVFTAEGDLWITEIGSGQAVAQRLTTHPAEEHHAAISPDGKWVAYSANYEGATEVYVIPSTGGVAKRLSHEHSRATVQGWTPAGDVIYSTLSRLGAPGSYELVSINPDTAVAQKLPLADAIEGVVDSEADAVYFVRFGLQVSTDNVRSYRGGAQGKLWRFQLGSNQEAVPLAKDHLGSIRGPMVAGNQVYFISDASGTDNIWTLTSTGQAKQLTAFDSWEVRSAKLNNNRIVFQHGPDIKLLNLSDDSIQTVNINLVSDFPNLREHWDNKPLKLLTSAQMAAKSDQVVLTARGRVAIAGNKQQRLIEVNTGLNSRTRQAVLSHDGQWIYAINDSSGEHEIWRYAADGSEDAKQLTADGFVFRWGLYLSPDGKWLAHDDKAGRLFLMNLSSGKNQLIIEDNIGINGFNHVSWSHDSQYIAVTRNHVNDLRSRIQLYAVNGGKTAILTTDKFDSYAPAFSTDGNWLYFLSDRNFKASPGSPWGDRNTGNNFDRRTEVFALALNSKAEFPFQAANELKAEKNKPPKTKKDSKEKQGDKEKSKVAKVAVEWAGLANRLWQVPVAAGNYSKLLLNKQFIYLRDFVNEPESKPEIKVLKMEFAAKPKKFTANVEDFQLSVDGEKMMVRQAGADNANIFIVPAKDTFPKEAKDFQVVTNAWQLMVNPQQEWQQIFHDTWLMHRDSLFDVNMRGVDWSAMKTKYSVLLNRITDRYELNDVLAQMTGELNALHSQVRGGDVPKDESSPKTATLGGYLVQQQQGVVIKAIYAHDAELPGMASPLAHVSVNAKAGDVIVSINGIQTPTLTAISRQLRNQVGKQVLLELKRGKETLKSMVTPVGTRDENRLRYQHWVHNKKAVVEDNNENIGYFHLYAMGANDFSNFAREFYAIYDKPALIIDVRRNRGGNIDSLILEKLLRRNWMYWQAPRGLPNANMQQTFGGHLVVLADQFTYSDGETFTAGIKAMNLGTVIGKQTAGAGVWLTGRNRVSDNGISRVAEFPVFDVDGNWVVEGHGVTPDIEVDNLPHSTFMGEDAQLAAAIKLLQQKMIDEPVEKFKAKDFPAVDQAAKDVKRID